MREKRGIKTNGFNDIETDIDGMKIKIDIRFYLFLLKLCELNKKILIILLNKIIS